MENYIAIVLILSTIGCTGSKNLSIDSIEGKFYWNGVDGVNETFQINSDSTFKFSWTQGLMNGYTEGKIVSIKNGIALLSDLQPNANNCTIDIPPQTKQDYYLLRISDDSGTPLIGANCITYSQDKLIEGKFSDESGFCHLDSLDIQKIEIQYAGFKNAYIKTIKNETPKSMMITLKEEDHYQYFTEQEFRMINKNQIEIITFERKKLFTRIKTRHN